MLVEFFMSDQQGPSRHAPAPSRLEESALPHLERFLTLTGTLSSLGGWALGTVISLLLALSCHVPFAFVQTRRALPNREHRWHRGHRGRHVK
jgi:hypothetical protein